MAKSKRYYWLKLKEGFFDDVRMKRLRKISGGETYTIIYIKLLLLSLKSEGKIYFQHVDETFTKELALVLDEQEDDISVALNYLLKVNLIQTIGEEEYAMTDIPNLTGSETEWAKKKREYRDKLKEDNVLEQSPLCLPEVRQERELEIDKEIDIDKEKDVEGKREIENARTHPQTGAPYRTYGIFNNVYLTDEDYLELIDMLGQNLADDRIDYFSSYTQSTGKTYQDHKATIMLWCKQDLESGNCRYLNKYDWY